MKNIIIIVIIIFIGGLFMVNRNNKINNNIEHEGLIEVSYSSSGDSNGNVDNITLDIEKEIVTTNFKNYHSDPLEVNKYKVRHDDVIKIINMVEKNKIIEFADFPIDTDLIAMDAPNKFLGLVYNNNGDREWYSISYDSKFPKGGFDKVKEVVNLLNTLDDNKDNLISSEIIED